MSQEESRAHLLPLNYEQLYNFPEEGINYEEQLTIARELGLSSHNFEPDQFKTFDKSGYKKSILNAWIVKHYSANVKEACRRLEISITDDQALVIGKCFSFPKTAIKGLLTPEAHGIAVDIQYHAIKVSEGDDISDNEAREKAELVVDQGKVQSLSKEESRNVSGCLKSILFFLMLFPIASILLLLF